MASGATPILLAAFSAIGHRLSTNSAGELKWVGNGPAIAALSSGIATSDGAAFTASTAVVSGFNSRMRATSFGRV